MIDSNGDHYLRIYFSDSTDSGTDESDWSLVADNDDFPYTYWFSYSDYEIYRPYEIKEKFYKKSTKLSEEKLENNGYFQVIGETYNWAYNWFFQMMEIPVLEKYFAHFDLEEKEKQFWKLVKAVSIREEVYILEDWLRLDLAEKWCKRNNISCFLDIPAHYPRKLPKEVIYKIKNLLLSELPLMS